jgi:hypothetical protein
VEVIENKGRKISRFLDFPKKMKELSDSGEIWAKHSYRSK